MAHLYLFIAIVSEVIATSALKTSQGFTRLVPSIVTALGYLTAFYCLSLTLRSMPVGIAYAVWSGIGIVLVSVVDYMRYGQRLDTPALVGIVFIIVGVLTINLLSKSTHN